MSSYRWHSLEAGSGQGWVWFQVLRVVTTRETYPGKCHGAKPGRKVGAVW